MVIPPYNKLKTITLSDTVDIEFGVTEAIYVGGTGGNIVLVMQNGDVITLTGVVAGAVYPFAVKRVKSTSTATDLTACYTN